MNNKELKISEIFYSHQGEGKYVGHESIFLRLSGCSLNCIYCDSRYADEGRMINIKDIIKEFKKYKSNNLVITGGEPMLQQNGLIELLIRLKNKYFVTIETNGTIIPVPKLLKFIDHWSVSPKLANSGNDIKLRLNGDAMIFYSDIYNPIFKYVISGVKDITEVQLAEKCFNLDRNKIYLMPEGKTIQEVNIKSHWLINECKKYYYNFSPRLHIMLFGNRRKV